MFLYIRSYTKKRLEYCVTAAANATNRPRKLDKNKKKSKNFLIGQTTNKTNQIKTKAKKTQTDTSQLLNYRISGELSSIYCVIWDSPKFNTFFFFSFFVIHHLVFCRDSKLRRKSIHSTDIQVIQVSALRHSSSLSRIVYLWNQLVSHLDFEVFDIIFCCI